MVLNSNLALALAGGAAAAEATGIIDITPYGADGGSEDGGGDVGSIGGIPNISLPDVAAPSFEAPSFDFDPSASPNDPAMDPSDPVVDFNPSSGGESLPTTPGDDGGRGQKNKKKNKNNGLSGDNSFDVPFTDFTLADGLGNDTGVAGDGASGEIGRDLGRAAAAIPVGVLEGAWNTGEDVGEAINKNVSGNEDIGAFRIDEKGHQINQALQNIGSKPDESGKVKNKKKSKNDSRNPSDTSGSPESSDAVSIPMNEKQKLDRPESGIRITSSEGTNSVGTKEKPSKDKKSGSNPLDNALSGAQEAAGAVGNAIGDIF